MFSMRLPEAYSAYQTPEKKMPGEMIFHSPGIFSGRFVMCETKIIKLPGPELLRLRQVSGLASRLRHLHWQYLLRLWRKNTA